MRGRISPEGRVEIDVHVLLDRPGLARDPGIVEGCIPHSGIAIDRGPTIASEKTMQQDSIDSIDLHVRKHSAAACCAPQRHSVHPDMLGLGRLRARPMQLESAVTLNVRGGLDVRWVQIDFRPGKPRYAKAKGLKVQAVENGHQASCLLHHTGNRSCRVHRTSWTLPQRTCARACVPHRTDHGSGRETWSGKPIRLPIMATAVNPNIEFMEASLGFSGVSFFGPTLFVSLGLFGFLLKPPNRGFP